MTIHFYSLVSFSLLLVVNCHFLTITVVFFICRLSSFSITLCFVATLYCCQSTRTSTMLWSVVYFYGYYCFTLVCTVNWWDQ